MFRAIIVTTLAVLISGCSWWNAYQEMAEGYEPTPPSEAEAQAHYNLLNNPPPGCEDDPVCKSDQIWATHRIGEYERERRKRQELMADDYESGSISDAEAQAHYNLLNNPPTGCDSDPACKSNQVWATYRIGEYERELRKREAREHCMRELYSERRARLGIPQCTGE